MCRCAAKQDNRPGRQNRLGKKGIAKVVASFLSVKSLICRFYWEETADCRRGRHSGGTDPILSTQRIPRGRDLIFSTQRIPRWGDHRGAMRQKMAIFKEGNSVCRVQIFQEWGNHRGRCVRKWRFSKRETAFDPQTFPDQFWWVFRYKFFRGQRWRALLMNTWNFRGATL